MVNTVLELLKARGAGRSISSEGLPEEVVNELVEAPRLAPSCFNNQPWRFLFLEGEEARAQGAEALTESNRAWAGRAPLLVIGYSRKEDDCVLKDGRAYHEFDLGLSVMSMILAATRRGLTARPMAGFDPQKVRDLLGLSADENPLVVLAVGRPSTDEDHLPERYRGAARKPRVRKPAGEIVRRL